MAGKTPISRLQELSSKLKLSAPEYELIFNRPEGLDPKFTYKCTFDGHVSQGSGRTKRDAKHESAGQLLTMLPTLEADGDDAEQNAKTQNLVSDPVVQPHGNKINTNYVGELAFYCMEILNAPEKPIYEEAGSCGASHNPTFTIKCIVSSYTTTAEGPTKKQAKHLASKYMLEKLEQLDKAHAEIPESTTEQLLDLPQMTETEKGTIKEVLVLQTPPNSELMEMSENINQIHLSAPPGLLSYPEDSKSDTWNSYECLQQICDSLGEGMLSFYNFRKMALDDPSPNLGFCDASRPQNPNENICSEDVVISCSVTVHIKPMNLHCKGLGSTVDECITYGASRMLQMLYVYFYECSPYSG